MNKRPFTGILTILFICIIALQADAGIVFYRDIYEKALKMAKKENKNVFVDTYTKYCIPCKKMDKVFREKKLGDYFNKNFINIKIDMDGKIGKAIHRKYDVFFMPTLLIIDKHGNVRYRSEKMMTGEELLSIGEFIVEGGKSKPTYASNLPPKATNVPATAIKNNSTKTTTVSPAITTNTRSASGATIRPVTPKKEQPKLLSEQKPKEKITKSSSAKNDTPSTPIKGEKILYVMDAQNGSSNPEILFQEAYFRMELMDGSHRKIAREYLKTQDDWTTEKNMRFIMDFLYKTDSPEFDYVIYNRHKFEDVIGKEQLARSIGILVSQKLHHGYPRPDFAESQALLSYVDPSTSRTKAYAYFLNRLDEEEDFDRYENLGRKYIKEQNKKDHVVLHRLAEIISRKDQNIKDAIDLVKNAIDHYDQSHLYFTTLAKLENKNGKTNKALKAINKAIEIAERANIDASYQKELKQMMTDL